MKSLREEMQSIKKASEAEVDKTSKTGPSKQSVGLYDPNIHPNPRTSDHLDGQPMETDFCGPSLPLRFGQSVQSEHGSKHGSSFRTLGSSFQTLGATSKGVFY